MLLFVRDEHHLVCESEVIIYSLSNTSIQRCLINIDSHPDMGVPESDSDIEIGTWIIPLLHKKAFTHVFWIFRHAHFTTTSFQFVVGKRKNDKSYIVGGVQNSHIPDEWRTYWGIPLDDNDVLQERRVIQFHACRVDNALQVIKPFVQRHMEVVISLDLDFFEVMNPMFDEVKKLPLRYRRLFQLLTSVVPSCTDQLLTLLDSSVDIDEIVETVLLNQKGCKSCECVYAPKRPRISSMTTDDLRSFLKAIAIDFKKNMIEDHAVTLLVQGATQPHHPESCFTETWPGLQKIIAHVCKHSELLPELLVATSNVYRPSGSSASATEKTKTVLDSINTIFANV
jgi:hypothetical protein